MGKATKKIHEKVDHIYGDNEVAKVNVQDQLKKSSESSIKEAKKFFSELDAI